MSFPFLQPYAGLSNSLQTAQAGGAGGPSVGGWVELARTTLGSNSSTLTVSSIPDKRYYFVLVNPSFTNAGSGNTFRLGSGGTEDSGSNYCFRRSTNGGSDVTEVNQSNGIIPIGGYSTEHELLTMHIANLSNKEKLCIHNRCYSVAGANNAPLRIEDVSKWSNTSNAIDIMKAQLNSSGQFASGTEIVVLGWDPADEHTSNFWQELASVELGSTGSNLSSGTISAKKYLWVQIWADHSTDEAQNITFNNDSGATYARRRSANGAADTTFINDNSIDFGSYGTTPYFWNMFIINNAADEKLVISNTVFQNTAGAANAPNRIEGVAKWTNNSSQITEIDLTVANTITAGAIMKVWGSD
jgi:hypothetical protein